MLINKHSPVEQPEDWAQWWQLSGLSSSGRSLFFMLTLLLTLLRPRQGDYGDDSDAEFSWIVWAFSKHDMYRVARSAQSFGAGDQEALFQLVSATSLSVMRKWIVELNFTIRLLDPDFDFQSTNMICCYCQVNSLDLYSCVKRLICELKAKPEDQVRPIILKY